MYIRVHLPKREADAGQDMVQEANLSYNNSNQGYYIWINAFPGTRKGTYTIDLCAENYVGNTNCTLNGSTSYGNCNKWCFGNNDMMISGQRSTMSNMILYGQSGYYDITEFKYMKDNFEKMRCG